MKTLLYVLAQVLFNIVVYGNNYYMYVCVQYRTIGQYKYVYKILQSYTINNNFEINKSHSNTFDLYCILNTKEIKTEITLNSLSLV